MQSLNLWIAYSGNFCLSSGDYQVVSCISKDVLRDVPIYGG